MIRRAAKTLLLVAPLGLAPAFSQAPAPQPPAEVAGVPASALAVAEEALLAALTGGEPAHPDQPSWRAAYVAAEDAVAAARASGDGDALRAALLTAARGYGVMGWYARTFAAFDEYFGAGGELPAELPAPAEGIDDLALFTRAANELAYARYLAGDHEAATGFYLTVLEVAPEDTEALRWLARIAFERGDVAGAEVSAQLWERLLEVAPDDATSRYYLDRSRQRAEVGVAASDSFHAGVASYEAGDLEGALQSFQAALTANPGFTDAEVWAGRVALEMGLPDLAAEHWRRVAAARPDDPGAAYFLSVAETQAAYGVRAGALFADGMAAYEAGDLAAAAERFAAAAEASPRFVDAWVWAARSLQEAGRAAESVPFWERVLELDPSDERAVWFLRRARLAVDRGDVAGTAFFDALAAFEAGDADTARLLLEQAVEAAPGFAEAWGYLGRVAFQQGRYEDAATAYGRAAELAPGVVEYEFFAAEARRLAGLDDEPAEPGGPDGAEPRQGGDAGAETVDDVAPGSAEVEPLAPGDPAP